MLLRTSHVQVRVRRLYWTSLSAVWLSKSFLLLYCQCFLQILKCFIDENTLTSIVDGIVHSL